MSVTDYLYYRDIRKRLSHSTDHLFMMIVLRVCGHAKSVKVEKTVVRYKSLHTQQE